jgi:hypothetical protein
MPVDEDAAPDSETEGSDRAPGRAGSGTAPPPGACAEPRTPIPLDAGAVQRAPVFGAGAGLRSVPSRYRVPE